MNKQKKRYFQKYLEDSLIYTIAIKIMLVVKLEFLSLGSNHFNFE